MTETATQTAIEAGDQDPQDFYDGLSQTGQDSWDAVASYGWRPEHMELGFKAARISDGFEIGPFESLSVLLAEVQQEADLNHIETDGTEMDPLPVESSGFESWASDDVADAAASDEDEKEAIDGEVELEADSQGRVFLPTMAPVVDQQVADAAGKYHAIKTERVALAVKEKAALDELAFICRTKPELFEVDYKQSQVYKVGDLVIRISHTVKEQITTEIESE